MRKSVCLGLIGAVLLLTPTAGAYAAGTATPSPQPTESSQPTAKPTSSTQPTLAVKIPKPALTQAQKDAISAARSAFSSAKANALAGFDRALADAQAIRDQAIAAAGKNHKAIVAAKNSYRDFYKIIMDAFIASVKSARLTMESAIATAKASVKTH